ncbi:MAG: cation diffusion facilitator family transporter [Planctomycetota bacterium]|jgi:cation diffusion facilitator family transporter
MPPTTTADVPPATDPDAQVRPQQFAIRLSLALGFLMLAGKCYAYWITGSAAILSDAAESVVHVVAVAFAAFSLWLSVRPADASHPYGHDRMSFFSAGVEGMLIVIAAVYIIWEAIAKWIAGLRLENLGAGTLLIAGAALVNLGLGLFLVRRGRRHNSLILVANGKHVLTDSWTSLGVIAGLLLVAWTGWLPFDPILAILVALNILWSGGKLVRESIGGLMDEGDPETHRRLVAILDEEAGLRGLRYHQLRHRNSGVRVWVDLHLLFPAETTIEDAHRQATEIEAAIKNGLDVPAAVISHVEAIEGHESVHREIKNTAE